MTYSKERAASISKSDIKYIPAGIIENVVLKSVKQRFLLMVINS